MGEQKSQYALCWILRLSILVWVTTSSACSTVGQYPASWPKIEQFQKNCNSIAGRYVEMGFSDYYGPKRSDSLSALLLGERVAGSNVVSVLPKENELEIVSMKGNQLLRKIIYTAKDDKYRCVDNEIEFFMGSRNAAERIIIPLYDIDKRILTNAADGSLIVRRESKGVGLLLFVIPVGGKVVSWYRFEKIKE